MYRPEYTYEWEKLDRYALYVRHSSRRHPIRNSDIPGIKLENITPMLNVKMDTTFSKQHHARLNKWIEGR